MSEPSLTGSMVVWSLPSAPLWVTAEGNFPGLSLEKFRRTRRPDRRALGCGSGGVVLNPLGHHGGMRLRPIVHIRAVCRVRLDPGLGKGVVQVRPLRHDVGIALELVLLEPAFDIGRYQLAGLGAASIGHNRTERAGDPVAQRVVGGRQG